MFRLSPSLIIAVFLLAMSFDHVQAAPVVIAEVTASRLNIRHQPNTAAEIVGSYDYGDRIIATMLENGWALVLFKNSQPAYVSSTYLNVVSVDQFSLTDPSNKMILARVSASALNIRNLPTIDSLKLGKLMYGEKVVAQPRNDGWAMILIDESTPAYVSGRYLETLRTVSSSFPAEKPCTAETTEFALNIDESQLEHELKMFGQTYETCSARMDVVVSTDCLQKITAELNCEAVFSYRTESSLLYLNDVETASGPITIEDGYQKSRVVIPCQPSLLKEKLTDVKLKSTRCTVSYRP